MFRRSDPSSITERAPEAGVTAGQRAADAGEPHDRCVRCGRPTPAGVALCEADNPARIKGPSATQVHGTIAVGIIGGFIAFALLARLATGGIGPFEAGITGRATQADGSVEVVVRVTNEGSRAAGASCRIFQGGVPGASDLVFFTERIPPGETRDYRRLVPGAAERGPVRQPGTIAVRCN